MPVDGKKAARLLFARLAQCKTSPTVLFWLKLRPQNLGATELGSALLRLCRELDVVQSPNFEFFVSVKQKCFNLSPISPDFFVVSRKKTDAVKNFREELRRRFILDGGGADPYLYMGALMPFCFQCLCAKTDSSKYPAKSLFFIFATPEDGMRKILEVLRSGKYFYDGRTYRFSQVYEHRLGNAFAPKISSPTAASAEEEEERDDNRVGYILLDWEVEEKKVGGRLTRRKIRELLEEFPTWFYERMRALKLVDHDAEISVVFKEKSRPLDGGANYKHSAHVIFEVAGVPATELKWVCSRVFGGKVQELLTQAKKAKDFSPIPDSTLRKAPWLGADLATMRGKTGFAVMFSRKNAADPSPRLLYRAIYTKGTLQTPTPSSGVTNPWPFRPFCAPHDLASLPEANALSLLYHGCCSVPKYHTARLSLSAKDDYKAQQSRTAAKHHAAFKMVGGAQPSPRAGGGGSSSVLPAWMLSTIVNSGKSGYTENRDSAQSYFKQLMNLLGEEERAKTWVAVHIGGGAAACPMHLSEAPPKLYSHRSNGVIVALVPSESPSVVYTRCTECDVLSATQNRHVERLMKSNGCPSCWMVLSKEGVEAVMEEAKRGMFVYVRAYDVCAVVNGSSLSPVVYSLYCVIPSLLP